MLENESQVLKRIYGVNILEEPNKDVPDKANKMNIVINDIFISDTPPKNVKKKILIGLQLLIIAAHIAFFILRIFHI